MLPIASLTTALNSHLDWTIAGLVVLLGLVVYGGRDLIAFRMGRAWAIGGVCFRESVRRRVLWILPLTIVGVIVVSQLQHPLDEQDAIRQSTKFCLFATGMVMTVTAIILACTNLPNEIESRVIYTIVTKPISRLEIVVGKIIGFIRISATILLIMGVFTYAYMRIRSFRLETSIEQRLNEGVADAATSATLTHYKEAGLLNSRTYAKSKDFQIFAREPVAGEKTRWMFGAEGSLSVPFNLTPDQLVPPNDPTNTPGSAGVYIIAHIGFDEKDLPKIQPTTQPIASSLPETISAPKPRLKATTDAANKFGTMPSVSFQLLDEDHNTLVDPRTINDDHPVVLQDASGHDLISAYIPPADADLLLKNPIMYVACRGNEPQMEFSAGSFPIGLAVPVLTGDTSKPPPLTNQARIIRPIVLSSDPTHPVPPEYMTNAGTYGVQLRGGKTSAPVAVYQFRGIDIHPDPAGNVAMELHVGIERSNDDLIGQQTMLNISVLNHQHGEVTAGDPRYQLTIAPEINRTSFFTIPASAVVGGNFDVQLRCPNEGQFVGVYDASLNVVQSEHSFVMNLCKSLLVLWMLSMLVVIVSIFCSTFLSWPIAVVLTVVILLGHWTVLQLGDATKPGIGNMVATDMGLRDPNKMRVISDSVEAMTRMLNVLSSVLPDISRFSALDDIEQGVFLPPERIIDSLSVICIFGIPLLTASYVFLRQKEVAP